MNAHVLTRSTSHAVAVRTAGDLATSLATPVRDDRELLRLCRRATVLLRREAEIEASYMDALDRFEAAEPARPVVPQEDTFHAVLESGQCEHERSSAMRARLKRERGCWHAAKIARYRERIARVAAWEKARAALDRETGMSRLDAAQKRAAAAAKAAIEPIVTIEAASQEGMASKAALLVTACCDRFLLVEEPFANLALSIATDAMLLAGWSALRQSH